LKRIWLLSGLILLLLLGGLGFPSSGLISLALPLLIYTGASLLFSPGKMDLSITRSHEKKPVAPGSPVELHVKITNQGPTLEETLIRIKTVQPLERVDGETAILMALTPGQTFELDYQVRGPRGNYFLPNIEVTARDHFGLFPIHRSFPQQNQIIILPAATKLHRLPIRPSQTRGFAGPIPSRMSGTGTDFHDVRKYLPGDPLRRINWRTSARFEQDLFTTQYEMERITDVGIIVDARQQTNVTGPGETLFEYTVRAAASLSDLFLKEGNRVGLLVYGYGLEWVFPGYGKHQNQRILRTLATAETGHNYSMENLNNLPVRLFPAHSQIVLVSPLLQSDTATLHRMRAQGYEILVVSPDPVLFELRSFPGKNQDDPAVRIAHIERRFILKKIRQAGINVLDWDTAQPFDHVVSTALIRSWVRLNLPEKQR
jgi:uncharacterized protein (DUF58 family)